MVQRGSEGVIVRIFWEWDLGLHWPILLFLRAPSPLILSSPLVLPFLAIDPLPKVILLTNDRPFRFTQGLLGILQLQVFMGFPVKLVYALTLFLVELIPKQGLMEHPIHEVS